VQAVESDGDGPGAVMSGTAATWAMKATMTTKTTTWAVQIAVLLVLLATGTAPASSGLLSANSPRGKNTLEGSFHQVWSSVSAEGSRGWSGVCAGSAADSVVAPQSVVENHNPANIRFSQNTAGGRGRADVLRQSMGERGWAGDPVDAVRTADGITTIDNTRVAVARELGIQEIPVRVHAPSEPLPPDMIGRFGDARTWGEALAQRTANQRPPLPPTGTPDAPRMPRPGN
jgi:hypothetical protein